MISIQNHEILKNVSSSANGMLPIDVYEAIFEAGRKSNGGTFVEIGTAHGAATIALALGAIEGKKPFRIYTVDPFSGKFSSRTKYGTAEDNERIVRELFRKFHVANYVTIVKGTSYDLVEQHAIDSIDILLMDADGRIDRDLALLLSRLSDQTLIIVDDLAGITHLSRSNGMLVLHHKQYVVKSIIDKWTSTGILHQKLRVCDTGFYSLGEARVSADEIALSALPIYRELIVSDVTRFGTSFSAFDEIKPRRWDERLRHWTATYVPGAKLLYHAVKKAIASFRGDKITPTKLGIVENHDFQTILNNPEIHAEWPEIARVISAIIEIPDGQTGGVNPGDRRALYYLTRGLKPDSILEIGTNVGASTLFLAAALMRGKSPERLVTVDIVDVNNGEEAYWRAARLSRSPRESIRALGAEALVKFVQEDSLRFLDHTEAQFDLIFLDGDHTQETVYQEIPKALNALRQEGFIILHDFFPGNQPLWRGNEPIPGPFLATEKLRSEGAQFEVLPLGELPWRTKAG